MFTTAILTKLIDGYRRYCRSARERARANPDGGYASETVLVTAILVGIAIAAGAILTAKVLGKVKSIDF